MVFDDGAHVPEACGTCNLCERARATAVAPVAPPPLSALADGTAAMEEEAAARKYALRGVGPLVHRILNHEDFKAKLEAGMLCAPARHALAEALGQSGECAGLGALEHLAEAVLFQLELEGLLWRKKRDPKHKSQLCLRSLSPLTSGELELMVSEQPQDDLRATMPPPPPHARIST